MGEHSIDGWHHTMRNEIDVVFVPTNCAWSYLIASGNASVINTASVQALIGLPAFPGALDLAAAGVETGGAAHNRRYVAGSLDIVAGVPSERTTLAHDPQTSGGLLAAVPPNLVAAVDGALDDAGVERWWIGRVEAGEPGVELAL
jgi:selenophosphate synthase